MTWKAQAFRTGTLAGRHFIPRLKAVLAAIRRPKNLSIIMNQMSMATDGKLPSTPTYESDLGALRTIR